MKKILALTMIMAFYGLSYGQTGKGNMLLGGGVNLMTNSGRTTFSGTAPSMDRPRSWHFDIMPYGGLFIADDVAVGLNLLFNSDATKWEAIPGTRPDLKNSTTTYGGGVFARKYMVFNEHFAMFGHVMGNYQMGNRETQTVSIVDPNVAITEKTKLYRLMIAAVPGVTIFMNKKTAFEISVGQLGYMSTKEEDEPITPGGVITTRTTGNFMLNYNLAAVNIGLVCFLGGN